MKRFVKKHGNLYLPTRAFKKTANVKSRWFCFLANRNPLRYWQKQAEALKWQKKWHSVFEFANGAEKAAPPSFKWFSGAKLNITENCLDENVKKHPDKMAFIFQPEPLQEPPRPYTYQELLNEVSRLANGLKTLGVKKGDRVAIYLPMIPEVIVSMLACARIGAAHTVVFSAFSSEALKVRLQDTKAKILITADGYYRRGKVINLKQQASAALLGTEIEKVIVVRRAGIETPMLAERDIWYERLIESQSPVCAFEIMDAEDLLFILYTSGCCYKDTLIQLDTGEVKTIADLVDGGGSNFVNAKIKNLSQDVEPINNKFKYPWHDYLYLVKTPVSAIKVTGNHPFFVLGKNGDIKEKQAVDLQKGDYVLQCRKVNVKGKKQKLPVFIIDYEPKKCTKSLPNRPKMPEYLTKELSQILGYFTGDGSLGSGAIFATDKDKNNLLFYKNLFVKCLKVRCMIKQSTRQRLFIHSVFLAKYLQKAFPEVFVGSYQRNVPVLVQKSEDDVVAAFIRGFFDAEGTVTGDVIKISSQSKKLIETVKLLLLRFGIVACYAEEKRTTHFKDKKYNVITQALLISDRDSINLFKTFIGFSDKVKSKNLNLLTERLKKTKPASMFYQLPINGILQALRNTIMLPKKECKKLHLSSYIYSKRKIKGKRLHLVREYIEAKINEVNAIDFSKRNDIKKAIRLFKVSQKELAKISGYSPATVHQYHNRKQPLILESSLNKFYNKLIPFLQTQKEQKALLLSDLLVTLAKIDNMEKFAFFEVKKTAKVEEAVEFVYDLEAIRNHNYIANGFVVHNSTGTPKGTIQTCGGYMVQAKTTGKYVFDWKENDVFWSTADIGWITGHTYSCYSPLLCGTTFILFEGGIDWPLPDRWCDIIEKYNVSVFYTAPTAIRMFEKYGSGLVRKHKLECLRLLGSVGEPIDESAWKWYFKEVGKEKCPIVDTWWQTETGGILITSLPGLGPFRPSFAGLALPGLKFVILDEKGKKVKSGRQGNLVLLKPFSPGLLRGIYKNPEKYFTAYWQQYGPEMYFTSDSALKDKNGLIRLVGRVDDVIKVAGHRFTTGEIEDAAASHSQVIEAAVVGRQDEIKGEVPVVFIVVRGQTSYAGKEEKDKLRQEVMQLVRDKIGPIALPQEIYIVDDLPKTRSGKIMRRILRNLFTGEPLGDLSTLANPEVVENLKKICLIAV